MITKLIVATLLMVVFCLPVEGRFFCTFYGGSHISSCSKDFEGLKNERGKEIETSLEKSIKTLPRFWEVGVETGYFCSYFSAAVVYKAVAVTSTNDFSQTQNLSLKNWKTSTIGLRLGTPAFEKFIQFRFLLALDRTKVNLYYPDFTRSGGSKTTLIGPELDLNIRLTPAYLRRGRGLMKFPLDIGIGSKLGIQRPLDSFRDFKENPTHVYAGIFLRLGFL